MKKIGILGGMSAISSQLYYKTLCDLTLNELGGLYSPNILLRSVDFEPISKMMFKGRWKEISEILNAEMLMLKEADVDLIILASNTMHKVADEIMKFVDLPFIHIAEAIASSILSKNCKYPIFLATKFTMEEEFYVNILKENSIFPIIPNLKERKIINNIIFNELCKNKVLAKSEQIYLNIIDSLIQRGADSIILGCTELPLILNESNIDIPIFNSTLIHCEAALKSALN